MPQYDGTGPYWNQGQGKVGRGRGPCGQGQGGAGRGRGPCGQGQRWGGGWQGFRIESRDVDDGGSRNEISRLEALVNSLSQRLAALEVTEEESSK